MAGVAIDVDAQGISSRKALGPIRIQHGDEMQAYALKALWVVFQKIEEVEDGHGRGWLVAVHLGPEQNVFRSISGTDQVNLSVFHRVTNRLYFKKTFLFVLRNALFDQIVFESSLLKAGVLVLLIVLQIIVELLTSQGAKAEKEQENEAGPITFHRL